MLGSGCQEVNGEAVDCRAAVKMIVRTSSKVWLWCFVRAIDFTEPIPALKRSMPSTNPEIPVECSWTILKHTGPLVRIEADSAVNQRIVDDDLFAGYFFSVVNDRQL